jgi:enoyl-CoA hydratase
VSDNILTDDLAPGVRRITLNRPDALNALLPSMYGELTDILGEIARDPEVRVVVLTGAGKGFCPGADISGAEQPTWIPKDLGRSHFTLHYMTKLQALVEAIRKQPQPVICAVNGVAAGMGFTLALACDMAIAAQSARFINAFHNAGTGHEAGLSYLLPHAVGGQKAAEILLTARPVQSDEAERIGLVLKTVPDDQLMAACLEIAEEIKANAPLDIWVTKQSLQHNAHAGSLDHAITFETRAIAMAITTEDANEKRVARREKRAPAFKSK